MLSCGPAENPVKRKRGRPKGSTKKTRTDLTECKAASTHSSEESFERQEERNKKEGDQQNLIEGNSVATNVADVFLFHNEDRISTCNMPS